MELELEMNEPQFKVFTCRKPLALVMAGQRGGKTHGIGLRTGLYIKKFPKVPGMIAANTYMQLTQSTMAEVRLVWKDVFNYVEYDSRSAPHGVYVVNRRPPSHFIKHRFFDDYRGIISFKNGCTVYTASLDNDLAHEGKTLGWCELDETKDTKQRAVKQVILARLSYKGLYYDIVNNKLFYSEKNIETDEFIRSYNPCVINTSPSDGVVEWLIDMFNLKKYEEQIDKTIFNKADYFYHEERKKAVCIYSTYWNEEHLNDGYIDTRLDTLTETEAKKFIYGYPFDANTNLYFDYFDSKKHISTVPRLRGLADHLTYDFNLIPYMTLVCSQVFETETEIQIRVYKEYCLKPPLNTTEDVTESYRSDHEGEIGDLFYYGDAMGTRGVEGYGDKFTRFDEARKVLTNHLSNFSDRTLRYNPGNIKRRNLINKILDGKLKIDGKTVVLLIDESCVNLIRDFRYLQIGMDGKLKEKAKDPLTGRTYEKLGHTTDALEYQIAFIFEKYL